MIDINKKYTYNGKPVRIYADGSDTYYKNIHIAYLDTKGWVSTSVDESELVEVWEPKEGELVYMFDDNLICVSRYGFKMLDGRHADKYGEIWKHIAQFKGELPEAFKGLKDD